MSSNHKAPLAAFVVVAIACVVVLATNSMRSYARDAWLSLASPVISGLELNAQPKQAPRVAQADAAPVVPAPAAIRTTAPAPHRVVAHAHHSTHHSHRAHHVATTPVTTVAVATVHVAPVPAVTSPGRSEHVHQDNGLHRGWAQAAAHQSSRSDHGDHGDRGQHRGQSAVHGNAAKAQQKAEQKVQQKAAKKAENGKHAATGVLAAGIEVHGHGNLHGHGNGHGRAGGNGHHGKH